MYASYCFWIAISRNISDASGRVSAVPGWTYLQHGRHRPQVLPPTSFIGMTVFNSPSIVWRAMSLHDLTPSLPSAASPAAMCAPSWLPFQISQAPYPSPLSWQAPASRGTESRGVYWEACEERANCVGYARRS